MSSSTLAFTKSVAVGDRRESPSAAPCFWPGIRQTSTSKSWILAIYRVTKAPGKSVPDQFNFATSTLASVFKINLILYNQ